MAFNKEIRDMRALLDSWSACKTDQQRLSIVIEIKALVETIQEPLKKRTDKARAAYDAKTEIIKKALKQFLTTLDKIYKKHEELGDSDVRYQMHSAIYRSFIQPQRGYSLPAKFGMFSDESDELVHNALREFLTHPEVLAASKALRRPEDRLNAFQDHGARSAQGNNYGEYFPCAGGIAILAKLYPTPK